MRAGSSRIVSPIPSLYHDFELHPDDPTDPFAFRIDMDRWGVGTGRIVFSQAVDAPAGARATTEHFDMTPTTAERRSAVTNPRQWVQGATALAVDTAFAGLRRGLVRP